MVAALERAGIIESDNKIALGGGKQAPFDDFPGSEKIGQRNGAEVVADNGAGAGGGCLEGGNSRNNFDRHTARGFGESGARWRIEQFENQRRHRVNAGIARADQRNIIAFPGKVQRMQGTALFIA